MKIGQKVTYIVNDFDGHNEYTGTIKEIHSDHIIVDCPGISDHLWFDDDNMDMLRKEN